MYLVLIETSGNQDFIFSTNRLRENIGASQLTYEAGTKWILNAVAQHNSETSLEVWSENPQRLRKLLRDPKINPPIEAGEKLVEILTAASGKALLLTKSEEIAKAIISHVTKTALKEAPGLDVSGVYEKIEDCDKDNSLADAIKSIHKTFEKARSRRPSPENRFLRLPIIASCAVSGLPASEIDYLGEDPETISKVSVVKRDKDKDAKKRLTNLDSRLNEQIDQLLRDEESTEEKRSWLAVVHADGNGLGQIFMKFEDYIGEDKGNRNYISKYREFSLALDECTEAAFIKALDIFPDEEDRKKNNVAPIVPLIIGGDDLTVVCDGRYALEFTRAFLRGFEEQTKNNSAISKIAQSAFDVGRLSACAGVAIIKSHFPFSVAYELAEKLIKSAKEVKRKVTCVPIPGKISENSLTPFPCSAIDFHILYDTGGVDLGDIRDKLEPQQYTKLYNRPYVVTIPEVNKINAKKSPTDEDIGMDWVEPRRWEVLTKWVNLLADPELLPSSQSHAMRTALFLGQKQAEAQYQLIQSRYPRLKDFLSKEHKASLFREEKAKDKKEKVQSYHLSSFLDALDAMDFLKLAQHEQNQTEEKAE